MDNLKELLSHPGWQEYCDTLDEIGFMYLGQLVQLDVTNPSNVAKIIELKSKIDCLKEITYLIERGLAAPEELEHIDKTYAIRLHNWLKKLWRHNEG